MSWCPSSRAHWLGFRPRLLRMRRRSAAPARHIAHDTRCNARTYWPPVLHTSAQRMANCRPRVRASLCVPLRHCCRWNRRHCQPCQFGNHIHVSREQSGCAHPQVWPTAAQRLLPRAWRWPTRRTGTAPKPTGGACSREQRGRTRVGGLRVQQDGGDGGHAPRAGQVQRRGAGAHPVAGRPRPAAGDLRVQRRPRPDQRPHLHSPGQCKSH